jgi:hypothetical protein
MGRLQKYTDKEIISAIEKHKGAIYLASEYLGCHPDTIYERAKKVKAIQNTIDRHRGKMLDVAELALYNAITRGENWAIAFCLKSIGRDRGYGDRIDLMVQLGLDPALLKELANKARSSGVDLAEVFEEMINQFANISAEDSSEQSASAGLPAGTD